MSESFTTGAEFRGAARGTTYRLGRFIASGGEGRVFALDGQPQLAAKLYPQAIDRHKARKLVQMIQLPDPQLRSVAAWPVDIILTPKKQPVGFVMPLIPNGTALHLLLTPKTRLQQMSQLTFSNLTRIAENLARAVATLHQAGMVIGDMNGQNFFVLPNGTVQAIDCDSMQIGSKAKSVSGVGVEEYIAPELQGKSLRNVRRTFDHDIFALSVLIFELLVMGRHPFAGNDDLIVGEAIRQGRHVFAKKTPEHGVFTVTGLRPTAFFSPEIISLFQQSLAKNRARPTATLWVKALADYRRRLNICPSNIAHAFPDTASTCPWCALEGKRLPPLFKDLGKPKPTVARGQGGTRQQHSSLRAVGGFIGKALWWLLRRLGALIWVLLRPIVGAVMTAVRSVVDLIVKLIQDSIRWLCTFVFATLRNWLFWLLIAYAGWRWLEILIR